MEKKIYKGHTYVINHLYTDSYYGRKSVYHILTNNQKYMANVMNEIVGYPNVESEAEHDLRYKKEPTMANAFKPYWTCKFVEDDLYEKHMDCPFKNEVDTDSYYEFIYKEPYDD